MMVLEDDSPMEAASSPTTPRNLLAWNITIPYIDFFDDDVKRERIPVFCIDVERNDRKAGEVKDPTCCHQRQEAVLLLRCLMVLHNTVGVVMIGRHLWEYLDRRETDGKA